MTSPAQMRTSAVTCPEAIRTKNRRHKKKSKVYTSKSWKETVAEFVKGKSCEWCGSTEHLLAHHPYRDTPDAIYQDLYLSGCIILCNTCHFMFHRRHKKKCPVCREHWMDLDVDMCYSCYLDRNPGLAEKIQEKAAERERLRKCVLTEAAAKRKADRHPCRRHMKGQVCKRSDCRCTFSAKKAPGCPYYLAKVRK